MYVTSVTPRDFCHRMKAVCEAQFDVLVVRPWNRFEPDKSLWWLIPSTDWPAYRFAKLYFDWSDAEHTGLLCGLHVEKGLESSVRSAYPSRKGAQYILDTGWVWHKFLRDLNSGAVTKAAAVAASSEPNRFDLKIEGGYVPDPTSFDPYSSVFQKTKATYKFSCTGATGECILSESIDPTGLMKPLSNIASLESTGLAIQEVASNAWLWIDFWFGVPLSIAQDGESVNTADEVEIWSRQLQPLSQWLRPT